MHPLRPKLADAVADELRASILAQRWRDWLPQERILAEELRVSRSTLRQALDKLKHDHVISAERSRGHRIVAPFRAARVRTLRRGRGLKVNLLMPGSIADIRSPAVRWIDDLRAQLAREGGLLQIFESTACDAKQPAKLLRRLTEQHPATCWILRRTGQAAQEWFSSAGLPSVVVGTCHDGVSLPSVDIDHRAVSRHAVGRIAACGHRHIALLIPAAQKAGDLETERGFAEGVSAASGETRSIIIRHGDGAAVVGKAVERIMRIQGPPTALLMTHPWNFLAAYCALVTMGLQVPGDVSLVCCTQDTLMDFVLPEPARYRVKPQEFSSRALRCIRGYATGSTVGANRQWILPEFVPGASLAPVKSSRSR
jgi:DNA-binding LacI/PurR family transcriptional regulator